MKTVSRLLVGGLFMVLAAGLAQAHPHVWVTMQTELVYAPDGRDLGSLPPPPTGNAVKTTDWFLIRCRAVPFRESWWGCGLMFGSWLDY